MVERLSSAQIMKSLSNQIVTNQNRLINLSNKISIGKKFINSSEDPFAITKSLRSKGALTENQQFQRNQNLVLTELELADSSLQNIKDILDRFKEIAISGGNDTFSTDERAVLALEVRTLGEAMLQSANAKAGNKYIFSGNQSDVPTFSFTSGNAFNSTVYKNGLPDAGERITNGTTSSLNIFDVMMTQARGAAHSSNKINPTISTTGDLDFSIDDGNGTPINFTANITAGMNLATVITTINTAFTGAGGAGAVAEEAPAGYLKLNTELITGNLAGTQASINIQSSSNTTTVAELGLKIGLTKGKDAGILETITALENALNANDGLATRNAIGSLDSNLNELLNTLTRVGALSNKFDALDDNAKNEEIKLEQDLAIIEDLDFIKASSELASLQAALTSSVQTTSNLFSGNIFGFLGG